MVEEKKRLEKCYLQSDERIQIKVGEMEKEKEWSAKYE